MVAWNNKEGPKWKLFCNEEKGTVTITNLNSLVPDKGEKSIPLPQGLSIGLMLSYEASGYTVKIIQGCSTPDI